MNALDFADRHMCFAVFVVAGLLAVMLCVVLGIENVLLARAKLRALATMRKAPCATCKAAAGEPCAELQWLNGRDMTPQQSRDGFTIIVDIRPDSPHGVDLYRGPIAFCPFCGTKIEAP